MKSENMTPEVQGAMRICSDWMKEQMYEKRTEWSCGNEHDAMRECCGLLERLAGDEDEVDDSHVTITLMAKAAAEILTILEWRENQAKGDAEAAEHLESYNLPGYRAAHERAEQLRADFEKAVRGADF